MAGGISERPCWRTEDAGDIGLCAAAAAQRARRPRASEFLVVASIAGLPEIHDESEHDFCIRGREERPSGWCPAASSHREGSDRPRLHADIVNQASTQSNGYDTTHITGTLAYMALKSSRPARSAAAVAIGASRHLAIGSFDAYFGCIEAL